MNILRALRFAFGQAFFEFWNAFRRYRYLTTVNNNPDHCPW